MKDTERIDQLFEDSEQVLAIAQQVLQAAQAQTQNLIRQRDAEIMRLRERVCELELKLSRKEELPVDKIEKDFVDVPMIVGESVTSTA